MIKSLFVLLAIALFTCPSLKGQTDKAKEEEAIKAVIEKRIKDSPCLVPNDQSDNTKEEAAIKAVIEADRAAYFKHDYNGVGDCWIKEPSSVKIWVDGLKETKIVGWDNINASQKKEAENVSWDRNKSKVTFSDFQFDITGNFAWIYYEANWEIYSNNGVSNLKQGRIVILKKIEGKWKYSLFLLYKKE